jgi:hypothetical protein
MRSSTSAVEPTGAAVTRCAIVEHALAPAVPQQGRRRSIDG